MRLTAAFDLSFSQAEVDFVIPDLEEDLPLAIDPFLLFKSRDQQLRDLHARLLSIFNEGIRLYRAGDRAGLDRLIDFPEVDEIGFGYSERDIRGRGLGQHLNTLLAEILAASPTLQERGLRHIEEMQLLAVGVGPDRVSDIAANVLKTFLIEYTQQQAEIWNIPITKDVPVTHFFDFELWKWGDDSLDLPLNPISGLAILLVPRRIVRPLPWINYDDYARTDFKLALKTVKGFSTSRAKAKVVEVTRSRLRVLDQYVNRKERESASALPALGDVAVPLPSDIALGNDFIARLQALPTGHTTSGDYQRLLYEILNFLFEPELTDGRLEVSTFLRTERRDIVYINEAEQSFLRYVRETYASLFVVFEAKNVAKVELDHINQMAAYLGARLGMLGFIGTRHSADENIIRKTYAVFNDTPSIPRKVILVISDDDLITMIKLKQKGRYPVVHLRNLYRDFRTSVQ